jgi:hypothetical protein
MKINKRRSAAPESNGGRRVKNDIILIAVLLSLAALAALALMLLRTEGDTVVVTVDGEVWGEYALHENRSVEIRVGESYNLLVIEDGRAYVREASCPDGICSAHRPIRYDGESIICLPNRVVVEIRAKSPDQPDIVA